MKDLTAIAVKVSDLERHANILKTSGMKYALLEIADEEGEKRLYFRAVSSANAESDVDFGFIRSVSQLDNV